MEALRTADGVHLCETGGTFVVLDLEMDRYQALAPSEAEALRAALRADAAAEEQVLEHLNPLFAAGVLTRAPTRGRPLALTAAAPPDASLLDEVRDGGSRMTPARLAGFVLSMHRAGRRLRRRPIAETVRFVRTSRPGDGGEGDADAVHDLAAAFHRMRPLFPKDRHCLLDSLALLDFLSRRRLHPIWIFGVRLQPWKAHCWVEHDRLVLNDMLDEVAQFTPILRV